MKQLFQKLNGKKTSIAAGIMVVSVVLQEVMVKIWGVDSPILTNIIQTLNYLGGALGAVGLTHKGIKAKQ